MAVAFVAAVGTIPFWSQYLYTPPISPFVSELERRVAEYKREELQLRSDFEIEQFVDSVMAIEHRRFARQLDSLWEVMPPAARR
jgi:hypothetical protein